MSTLPSLDATTLLADFEEAVRLRLPEAGALRSEIAARLDALSKVTPVESFKPWKAWVNVTGWSGAARQQAIVIAETPHRYRVRASPGGSVRLAGRGRRISGDETALVPKRAVERIATEGETP